MLKFKARVVDLSNGPPPPKRLKFSAQVAGGITVELPKNIKFIANVVQDSDRGSS